ncbi:hypothetical protein Pfo_000620 [Paulownia fortunei]|nr:hypothetical protein Pfo_000620 [Paulownia fortunei]
MLGACNLTLSLLTATSSTSLIDGSHPCPSPIIMNTTGSSIIPAYPFWIRQDQLLLNVIISSISLNFILFIATTKTSIEAWTVLLNTYAKSSRGRILQLRGALDHFSEGTKSITEYTQLAKSYSDGLSFMSAPYDADVLTLKILNGLGGDYFSLADVVKARENSSSFIGVTITKSYE